MARPRNANRRRFVLALIVLTSLTLITPASRTGRPGPRGAAAGIEDGMAVLAPDGVVGHVIDSWHGGCKVRVLTDPDSAIAVRTTAHPVTGIAQGHTGGRELTVADFDTSADVKVGDDVV